MCAQTRHGRLGRLIQCLPLSLKIRVNARTAMLFAQYSPLLRPLVIFLQSACSILLSSTTWYCSTWILVMYIVLKFLNFARNLSWQSIICSFLQPPRVSPGGAHGTFKSLPWIFGVPLACKDPSWRSLEVRVQPLGAASPPRSGPASASPLSASRSPSSSTPPLCTRLQLGTESYFAISSGAPSPSAASAGADG